MYVIRIYYADRMIRHIVEDVDSLKTLLEMYSNPRTKIVVKYVSLEGMLRYAKEEK